MAGSPNPRIQVCADPILYAQIKTLAKARNMTMSNVVQSLCADALQTDEIRAEYKEACETYGEVPAQPDQRKRNPGRAHFKSYGGNTFEDVTVINETPEERKAAQEKHDREYVDDGVPDGAWEPEEEVITKEMVIEIFREEMQRAASVAPKKD